MIFSDINPFMRFAQLQPVLVEGDQFRAAYDYRIFYVLSGTAVFVTESERYELSPGSALFFRPGLPYRFIGRIKIIVLNFDLTRNQSDQKKSHGPSVIGYFRKEQIFEDDPPDELKDPIVVHQAYDLEPLLKKCVSYHMYPTAYSGAHASALIKEMLCMILQEFQETTKELPDIVQQVMLYIRENFDKEIKNTDISATFGYHPYYLNRLFKEHTGRTLHQTVLHIRIKNAKGLLKRTSLSIETIVKEVGFSDRTQFCTTFHKATGMTPSEYRKKNSG